MKNQVEKQIELKAPIPRAWRALTDYREFGQWFGVKLETPFVAGQVNRGKLNVPGYEHLTWEVVIQKIEPEKLFSFTWHPYAIDPTIDYSKETPTLVEFSLKKTSTGCLLRVVESGFGKIPPHRQLEALRMNDQGWGIQMENIEKHVQSK
jgi:uncharacterized protein YndB with AHSA1/START domain